MSIYEKKNYCLGVVLVLILWAWPAQAASYKQALRQGDRFYDRAQYDDALKMYKQAIEKDSQSEVAYFKAGMALYKKGRYDDSIGFFQKAIVSENKEQRKRGHYNLGNAFYKSGMSQEKTDLASAVALLEESIRQFSKALEIDKKDKDAQYNYDFVSKDLERLRKELEKQPKNKKKSGQGGEKKEDKNGEEDQSQSGQNQNAQQGQGQQQQQFQDQNQQQSQQEQEASGAQQQQSDSQEDNLEKQEQDGQKESGDESSQEEQPKQNSVSGASEGADSQGEDKTDAPTHAVQGRELTQEEARRLLQHYQQNEEPKGLFPVFKQRQETGPVIKDW